MKTHDLSLFHFHPKNKKKYFVELKERKRE